MKMAEISPLKPSSFKHCQPHKESEKPSHPEVAQEDINIKADPRWDPGTEKRASGKAKEITEKAEVIGVGLVCLFCYTEDF